MTKKRFVRPHSWEGRQQRPCRPLLSTTTSCDMVMFAKYCKAFRFQPWFSMSRTIPFYQSLTGATWRSTYQEPRSSNYLVPI